MGALHRPLPDSGALVSEINGRWIDNIGSGRATLPFPTKGAGASRFRLARHSALECDEGTRVSGRRGPGERWSTPGVEQLSQARADIGRAAGPFE